jgi:hypothetical protein
LAELERAPLTEDGYAAAIQAAAGYRQLLVDAGHDDAEFNTAVGAAESALADLALRRELREACGGVAPLEELEEMPQLRAWRWRGPNGTVRAINGHVVGEERCVNCGIAEGVSKWRKSFSYAPILEVSSRKQKQRASLTFWRCPSCRRTMLWSAVICWCVGLFGMPLFIGLGIAIGSLMSSDVGAIVGAIVGVVAWYVAFILTRASSPDPIRCIRIDGNLVTLQAKKPQFIEGERVGGS